MIIGGDMEEVFSVQSLRIFDSIEYSVISPLIIRLPVVKEAVGELSSSHTLTWGFCHVGYTTEFINLKNILGGICYPYVSVLLYPQKKNAARFHLFLAVLKNI
jgi:hypothetical protein